MHTSTRAVDVWEPRQIAQILDSFLSVMRLYSSFATVAVLGPASREPVARTRPPTIRQPTITGHPLVISLLEPEAQELTNR